MDRNKFLTILDEVEELLKEAPFEIFKDKYNSLLTSFKVNSLSDLFLESFKKSEKSTVYTPKQLSIELSDITIRHIKDLEKSDIKILDCSAGSGILTFTLKELLKGEKDKSFEFFALDTNPIAGRVFNIEHYIKFKKAFHNFKIEDFLKHESKYDVIIGNPPYSGHKDLDKEYKKFLSENFSVFTNKADIYYAFFEKAHSCLNEGGILSFIVSRYFLEALSARELRRFILDNFKILYIHDYYGTRPFNAGVDPVIITAKKIKSNEDYDIEVIRALEKFTIKSSVLNEKSMTILNNEEEKLIRLIENNSVYFLSDVGTFTQGIISGLDKAFVINKDTASDKKIEADIIFPWIKSKTLKGKDEELFLIYPPKDIESYPNFKTYIEEFEEKLSKRREVKSGARKFHELQWGRKKETFLAKRMIFAYKSSKNNFQIAENVFHSADIYSYTTNVNLEELVKLLNSNIYDRYIKLKLKKLGLDLYEYYPNRLEDIMIPDLNKVSADEFISIINKEMGRI